jgi:hypothetical protein
MQAGQGYSAAPTATTERGPDMADPKPHVKNHLQKNNVNPNHLPDGVIETLNSCSPAELNAMYKVGDSLQEAKVETNLRISAMH